MSKNYTALATISRRVMLASYAGLLLVIALGTLLSPSCDREPSGVMWLLYSLPLLAFLPAMLSSNGRALAWFCFVLLLYFLFAVLSAFTCAALLTNLEVALIVILFNATMLHIRWQSLATKAAASTRLTDQESVDNG